MNRKFSLVLALVLIISTTTVVSATEVNKTEDKLTQSFETTELSARDYKTSAEYYLAVAEEYSKLDTTDDKDKTTACF